MSSVTHEHRTMSLFTKCENHKVDRCLIDKAQRHKTVVADIEISYKVLGTGEPLILIMGFGGTMNNWDASVIRELSLHNTIIVFDNRGVGGTTHGKNGFTISQFANDTAGLLESLDVKKTSVLGFSMGGMIAQELALNYPEKVKKLILYASHCGGNESRYISSPEAIQIFSNLSGSTCNILLRSASLMFPMKWREDNPNYTDLFDNSLSIIPTDTIINQSKAIFSWRGTFTRLKKITKATMLLTGLDDILVPSINSSIISRHITDSKLIQIIGGGHGLMYQFPDEFSNIVSCFLDN
jgi:pimeloyl-ACP methyl ester carboxylesterase